MDRNFRCKCNCCLGSGELGSGRALHPQMGSLRCIVLGSRTADSSFWLCHTLPSWQACTSLPVHVYALKGLQEYMLREVFISNEDVCVASTLAGKW